MDTADEVWRWADDDDDDDDADDAEGDEEDEEGAEGRAEAGMSASMVASIEPASEEWSKRPNAESVDERMRSNDLRTSKNKRNHKKHRE